MNHSPSMGLYTAASGSVTTLRLKPSPEVQMEPPVPVSASLLPSASPQAPPLDLSLERQLAEAAEAAEDGGAEARDAGDVGAFLDKYKPGELPGDPGVAALAAKGLPPAAAALGQAYGRPGRGGADRASDFASKLEQLQGMGFGLAAAAGALARHKGDVEAATEACLTAPS
ncbi:hypothetical protein HYH03_009566 [Edaphochlamys debaryana]|uniref:UBA domain-containing protein n=1 Tax=Edaphochlamys debaryana TaxID=47281 RepID=A0A835XZW1_9CHLO|nr:hypothetical protein HYH03_009566 [Edaphochlamys debaryana]|eukprot:KAG2492068.1 hypothetical protein HYH03_009566 [Edaphochlamys debaryana]